MTVCDKSGSLVSVSQQASTNFGSSSPTYWEQARFKYLGEYFTGISYKQADEDVNGIPVLRSTNVQAAKLDFADLMYIRKGLAETSMLEKGDVLICSCNGSPRLVGKCAYIEESNKYSFGAFMMVFRSPLGKYGYYLLCSNLFDYYRPYFATTTIYQLTGQVFGNIKVAIPPQGEREKIVDLLDQKCGKIERLIRIQEQKLAILQEYEQVLISKVTTQGLNPESASMRDTGIGWLGAIPSHWETLKLNNLFEIRTGATPSTKVQGYWDGLIPWITPADYTDQMQYISEGSRNITESGYAHSSTCKLPAGSLIFSMRASLGRVVIAAKELCTNQDCFGCIPRTRLNSHYFYYVLKTASEYLASFGSGTTIKGITLDTFSKCKVPIPPLEEQEAIASYLDGKCERIRKCQEVIQKEIEVLKEYRLTLISKAVTGNLPSARLQ